MGRPYGCVCVVKERPCELGGRGTIGLNRFGGKVVFAANFDNVADDIYNNVHVIVKACTYLENYNENCHCN